MHGTLNISDTVEGDQIVQTLFSAPDWILGCNIKWQMGIDLKFTVHAKWASSVHNLTLHMLLFIFCRVVLVFSFNVTVANTLYMQTNSEHGIFQIYLQSM